MFLLRGFSDKQTSGKKQLRAPQTKWTTLIGAHPGSEYKKHQRRFVRPRLRTAMRRYKLAEAFFKRTFFFLVARAVCPIRHPDGQRRRRRRTSRTRGRGRERERSREREVERVEATDLFAGGLKVTFRCFLRGVFGMVASRVLARALSTLSYSGWSALHLSMPGCAENGGGSI